MHTGYEHTRARIGDNLQQICPNGNGRVCGFSWPRAVRQTALGGTKKRWKLKGVFMEWETHRGAVSGDDRAEAGAKGLKIAFLHPELGIGGAERLIVDAAVELSALGHEIRILTSRHDPGRCFSETLTGRFSTTVRGGFMPGAVRNRFRAVLSVVRMLILSLSLRSRGFKPDVVFCDLVPHVVLFLRFATDAPVVFYCHYPDLLLAPARHGLYGWYRILFDHLERAGMLSADRILVNSEFTGRVFRDTFRGLRGLEPIVVYPGVPVERFTLERPAPVRDLIGGEADDPFILSLNRFDPRKNLGLALEALNRMREKISPEMFSRVRLVVAGGYDESLPENRRTFEGLQELARRLDVSNRVVFLRSVTDEQRFSLLKGCVCLVYTSLDEHFGIGVVEGMAAGRPVLAVNRGGPLETVSDGITGFLREPEPGVFAQALARIIVEPGLAGRMGTAGRARARTMFSRRVFGRHLDAVLRSLTNRHTRD